jgi:hypothetical protein
LLNLAAADFAAIASRCNPSGLQIALEATARQVLQLQDIGSP